MMELLPSTMQLERRGASGEESWDKQEPDWSILSQVCPIVPKNIVFLFFFKSFVKMFQD